VSELDQLLERLRRGPEVLAAALTGAAGSELDFHGAPERWSIRQIVAHVSDAELAGAFRVRRILAEENPALEAYDQDAWAARLDYSKRKPSQSLETFRRVRQEIYELLRDAPATAFARTGYHTERGTITLLDLVKLIAEHPENHAQQIGRVRSEFKAQKNAKA
jgi:hypothetical protein